MAHPPPSPAGNWWREHGEPCALTALAIAAASLPPLLLLEILVWSQAMRLATLIGWAAACLLLLRLPRLLGGTGRRLALLATLLAFVGATLWAGAARPAAAQGGLSFKAAPRISQSSFTRILTSAGSPAAPHGDELYAIIVGYGLDPAVALAFFQHESQFCTTGKCARAELRNWGMLRRTIKAHRGAGSGEGFARYVSWQESVRDWCELMLGYIGRGMETVEKAIPVYAPPSDGNNVNAYVGAIRRQVAAWSGSTATADPTLRAYDGALDQALVTETFLASALDFHPTWAFHTYMLAEARAGRPLGAPLDESRIISVGGKRYAVQVFALDTLFTPIAPQEADTNWGDVRRLSTILRTQPTPTPTP